MAATKETRIKIEPVKSNEVDVLADISTRCFYDTFHQHNSEENMKLFLKESFNVETLDQELLAPDNYFFFAKTADEIVGYIKLSIAQPPSTVQDSDALEISRIYVVKDKIGFGIGKQLIEFAFLFATDLKKSAIWLGVWEENLRAINFYRNYGFIKFGEHIFMVGNDPQTDWLMRKDLDR